VSWLSDLFDKILRRNSGSQQQRNALKTTASPLSKPELSSIAPCNGEFNALSLGGVFSHSPPYSAGASAYDLQQPPKITAHVLKKLREQIKEIPAMPEIWQQVQDIVQQEDSSARDLGMCVAQDPVLTAHILKLCNSSMYASAGSADISNIPLAIARLGLDEASNIIFLALAPDLGGSQRSKLEIRSLWFHSQTIAMLSRVLAEPAGTLSRHEASLIGMMHDIGKLVILHIEPESLLDELKILIEQGTPTLAAEHKILGYTHIDAGMMLALHWQLPKHVQHFIAYHHHLTACYLDDVPEELQVSMMVLQAAHLLLQDAVVAEPGHGDGMIWKQNKRTCMPDAIPFMHNHLHIPLDSASFYAQIQSDIERMKRSFPDLFEA